MSAILELSAARTVLAGLCDELGLVLQARALRVKMSENPGLLRGTLLEIRVVATALHAVSASRQIGQLASDALLLEKTATHALVVCDRVIAERHAMNEAGPAAGLKLSARPGFR